MEGYPLKKIISHSGLPEEVLEPWILTQATARGYDPKNLSLEDLREILADILQDLILSQAN